MEQAIRIVKRPEAAADAPPAARQEAVALADECVQFGFCISVCPTYVLTRDEDESPRGRIDLIRAMLESDAPPEAATVRHVDQCLSCLSCMSTCAARVDYAHLVDEARVHIEQHYRRPFADRVMRGLVAAVIPKPARLRLALRMARWGRPLARFMGRRLRGMLELAPAHLPQAAEASRLQGSSLYPAQGERRLRVALLPGCAQQVLGRHINEAAIRVLTRHGCEVVVPQAECCGALTVHMGKAELGRRAAAQSIDALMRLHRESPLDAVVSTASGCGTTMKDYGHLFSHDAARLADARTVAALVQDITETLHKLGSQQKLAPVKSEAEAMPSVEQVRGMRVAYHDACSLQHGQHVRSEPRALLRQAGFDVADVPEGHFCCGSAGTYNLLQPETAAQLGARKAAHIESTGAQLACAGNLGCLEQLRPYLKMPIVHTVELLDWATGGPPPSALRMRDTARAA